MYSSSSSTCGATLGFGARARASSRSVFNSECVSSEDTIVSTGRRGKKGICHGRSPGEDVGFGSYRLRWEMRVLGPVFTRGWLGVLDPIHVHRISPLFEEPKGPECIIYSRIV